MHVHVRVRYHASTVLTCRITLDVLLLALFAMNWIRLGEELTVAQVAHNSFGSRHVFFNWRRFAVKKF